MAKYMLFKYDDKQFESGDHIKMYPVKRIELTEEEIKNMLLGLCGGDGEYWSDTGEIEKLRKVL